MEIAGKMLTWETAQTTLTWLSVLAGGAAAYLWYRASVVVVCEGDPKDVPGYYLGMNHPWAKKAGKQISVLGTFAEGSRLNQRAAIVTGISIGLQALAVAAGYFVAK
ncbi:MULTISPECIES: hypothetical protein [unclassified Bradyrhizobium]|uniref:hypothetical protein n=1 Tax=unclassified Bradyrhizobium TaxID=2631580 RepID=UPI0028E8D5E3|nr:MULTISPECIES: hypothetical protein [unclassified Bradyrhizobium]